MSSGPFSIIGDSNVVDNMTTFNTQIRDLMKKAQVIRCPALSKLCEAFNEIRYCRSFHHSISSLNGCILTITSLTFVSVSSDYELLYLAITNERLSRLQPYWLPASILVNALTCYYVRWLRSRAHY